VHLRPRWYIELALLVVGYEVYAGIRNTRGRAVRPGATKRALGNAQRVIGLERRVGLFHELPIQQLALRFPWIVRGADVYYATAHFVVTAAVLVWLFVSAPFRYRVLRTALAISTGIALVCFGAFPVMPPRLVPSLGFVDTLQRVGGLWSFRTPAIERISDPFAALPSLHLVWATWCALAVYPAVAHRGWLRRAVVAYPMVTAAVVIVTANHYLLDAVTGVLVTAAGLACAVALTAGSRHRPVAVPAASPGGS